MIELDQMKLELQQYETPLEEVRDSLDLDYKKQRIEELSRESEAPDFWNDADTANKKMKQLKDLQTLVEDAHLLPFDAVMERFDQMVRVKYEGMMADPGWGGIRSMEVRVDRIELSLERVIQPDNIDGGLLVPVWSFFGSILCTRPGDSFNHAYDPTVPFLTLNAVDGTLIDPRKGY